MAREGQPIQEPSKEREERKVKGPTKEWEQPRPDELSERPDAWRDPNP